MKFLNIFLLFAPLIVFSQKNQYTCTYASSNSNNKASYVVGKIFVVPESKLFHEVAQVMKVIEEDKIIIYPNPVTDLIHIKGMKMSKQKIEIFDIYGKVIYSGHLPEEGINMSHCAQGIYILTIDEKFINHKIIKL